MTEQLSTAHSQIKTLHEKKNHRPISLINTDAKLLNKPNLATYKNNYTPGPNGIYFKFAKLVEHLKKNQSLYFTIKMC